MFVKLPAIEGGIIGCWNCGYIPSTLPPQKIIAVGFGEAYVEKDGVRVWEEKDNFITCSQVEKMAKKEPNSDWRIHFVAPLNDRHYQRQGDNLWVLYEKGQGFA